jgi:hypothetical protein
VATEVSLKRRSIHSAAADPCSKGSAASRTNVFSAESRIISSVIDMDLLFPERKSEMAQKNVTVYGFVSGVVVLVGLTL